MEMNPTTLILRHLEKCLDICEEWGKTAQFTEEDMKNFKTLQEELLLAHTTTHATGAALTAMRDMGLLGGAPVKKNY